MPAKELFKETATIDSSPLITTGRGHRKLGEFARLGERIRDAELVEAAEEADRLTRERSSVVSLFLIVEHALGENADKRVSHFQMLTDFHTVSEIAGRLSGEFG